MLPYETVLIVVSILMQATVAVMSFYRASKSADKLRITWSMLSVVFSLMAFRRAVSFLLSLGISIPFVFPEIVAFVISLLLCISVYNIGKILPALENVANQVPETSVELKRIANELSEEVLLDAIDIEEYKNNGDSLLKSRKNLTMATERLVEIANSLENILDGGSLPKDEPFRERKN